MTDFLLPFLLSNLITSTFLALLAWGVQRSGRSPLLAHFFWTLVLVKMVTPPVFTFQWIPLDKSYHSSQVAQQNTAPNPSFSDEPLNRVFNNSPSPAAIDFFKEEHNGKLHHVQGAIPTQPKLKFGIRELIGVGLLGSLLIAVIAGIRIVRFNGLLSKNSWAGSESLRQLVAEVSLCFGLKHGPIIQLTRANVSPFVWWLGGTPRLVISAKAVGQLNNEELRMVLAHEIAHIYRRDHWVRWLEFTVGILLWWNPVTWIAKRQLRVTEEMACDELVIEKMQSSPHTYANSLLSMAELLSTSALRPPTVASAMTSGGVLENRLKMIISDQKIGLSLGLRGLLLMSAFLVFPLGLVYGQDVGAVKKRLEKAVEAKEITRAQASFMLEALELSMTLRSDDQVRKEKRDADKARDYTKRETIEREMIEKKKRYAQVERELKDAVERGKMNAKDAKAKADAIRKELFKEMALNNPVARERYEAQAAARKKMANATREIMAAVESGKLSKQDAEQKLDAIRKGLVQDSDHYDAKYAKEKKDLHKQELTKREMELKKVYQEIEKAVKEGKISKQDAQEKIRAFQSGRYSELNPNKEKLDRIRRDQVEMQRDMESRKKSFQAITEELKRAVEKGELSQREAEMKVLALEKQLYDKLGKKRREKSLVESEKQFEAYMRDLELAVRKKEISREEAMKKAEMMRRNLTSKPASERGQKPADKEKASIEARKRLESVAKDLEQAVKNGKMSKEDARKRLEDIKRELANYSKNVERERAEKDRLIIENEARKKKLEAVIKELEAAVKQGRISKEEAKDKFEAIRRSLSSGKDSGE